MSNSVVTPCGDLKKNRARMTSSFGDRRAPIGGHEQFHNGIDLRSANVPTANIIYSATEGEVVRILEPNPKYPCFILDPSKRPKGEVCITPFVFVRDPDKQVHVYAHVKPLLGLAVGQKLALSEKLGDTRANWGYSNGIHLHYTIFNKNFKINSDPWSKLNFKYCINPYEFLTSHEVTWCDKDFKPLTDKTPAVKR